MATKKLPRHIHFVGTIPEKDAAHAMDLMLDKAGPYLMSMPDGETSRPDYVTDLVIGLRKHPAIEQILPRTLPGMLRNFFDLPLYRLRDPAALTPESLNLGYADEALASWPVFQKKKAAAVKAGKASPDLTFQVGIPGDLQLPFMAFKAAGFDETHRKPFTDATVAEIRKIHKATKGQVIFQLELPSETVLTAFTPRSLREKVAERFARGVVSMVEQLPDDVRLGIHACNIDMNKKSLLPFVSANATVTLANAIFAAWPKDRAPIEFLHFPWARGDRRPRFNTNLVRELRRLQLPKATRLIMGLTHDEQSFDDQLTGVRIIEAIVGHPVDIGATCGLGRLKHAPKRVRANIDRSVELAASL